MTSKQWLHNAFGLREKFSRASRRGRSRQPSRRWRAPRLELLEVRLAPAILTVNSNADNTTDTSHLNLREAIWASEGSYGYTPTGAQLNQISGTLGTHNDTIRFDQSTMNGQTISLTISRADNSVFGPSAFLISGNETLVIDGVTGLSQGITITHGSTTAFRFLQIYPGCNVTLKGLTISGFTEKGNAGGTNQFGGGAGGGSAGLGGAIFNQGNLTIFDSTLTGNTAQGGAGAYNTPPGSGSHGPGGGGGGGGLNGQGGVAPNADIAGHGGGPNGGTGGFDYGLTIRHFTGYTGGFGGGGGGGYGYYSVLYDKNGYSGGMGGFGGGGGGGGVGGHVSSSSGPSTLNGGPGGTGGFGGGGGGGGSPGNLGDGNVGGAGGYGGGKGGNGSTDLASGGLASSGGGGGGGAGMGGAVFNQAGTVVITNSTFTGNAASGGAALGTERTGTAGKGLGGGLFNHNGTITVTNSTFSGNTAADGGSDIFNFGDSASAVATGTITNTILGGDFTGKGAGNGISGTNNLIRTQSGFFGSFSTADPRLGPLQNNGGLTNTMMLLGGSPAIAAGTKTGAPTTDQRGLMRDPFNVGSVDIGAYGIQPTVATMTVNTAADNITADNFLSLREALALANGTLDFGALSAQEQVKVSQVGGLISTINFDSTVNGSTLTLSTVGDNRVGPSAFLVPGQVIINGPSGNSGITLSAAGTTMRLFDVTLSGKLTLQNLTLSGGNAQGFAGGNASVGGAGGGSAGLGGAIFNQGTLTILNSTLTGNTAQGGAGGSYHSGLGTSGGGGGGLAAAGGAPSPSSGGAGGGPNGGKGGYQFIFGGVHPTAGGFGGGGGGGLGAITTPPEAGQPGAAGNFGGGGGGGGFAPGIGGKGGFGGGGGGGYGGTQYGGGSGGPKPEAGGGGGGVGMGGAVFNEAGTVVITNSTVTGNTASGGAGGAGPVSAFNGTAGKGLGGGLFNHNGTITVTNSTFSANTAADGGRDVFNLGDSNGNTTTRTTATATINNSILGQSNTTGQDFTGTTNGSTGTNSTSGTNNLIRTQSGFAGSFSTADPGLTGLASNGGPTQTMALQANSPAIDAGSNAAIPAGVTTDQRGLGYPRILNGTVDIGAFESKANPVIVLSPTTASVYGQVVTFTAMVSAPAPGSVTPTGSVTFTHDGKNFANQPVALDANGIATFSTPALGAGTHTITAMYGGDANFSSATAPSLTQSVTMNNTVVSILPSSTLVNKTTNGYQAPYSTNVTFTVVVAGQAPGTIHPPAGDAVTITDKVGTTTTTIATGMLDASGHFSFSTRNFAAGTTHVIKALFGGDSNFKSGTSLAMGETVIKAPITNTVNASANPATVGTTLTITASIADAISGATAAGFIPTGVVFFRDTFNGVTSTIGSSSGIALNSSGQAILSFSPTVAQVGTHSITAIYTGSPSFAGKASASVAVVVTSSQGASVDGALVLQTQRLASVNGLDRGNQPAGAQALATPGTLTTSPTRVDAYFASISRRRVGMLQVAHRLLERKDDSLTGVW
jgi:hypothetical protein